MIPATVVIGAPMAAALGLAYGMGPCLISCMPFLGPVFLAADAADGGVGRSWKVILPLSLGRLAGYGAFGLIAGMFGHYVKDGAANDMVRAVAGCAMLMMGLALLPRRASDRTCGSTQTGGALLQLPIRRKSLKMLLPGGLFLMGVGMALNPCAPLGVVLFSAAATGSAAGGLLLSISFGVGTIVVPSLVYGVGMAYMGARLREQLRDWRPLIERASALLLVVAGIGNLARWL